MSKVIHVTLVARTILPTLAHVEPADVTALNEAVIRANLEKINRGDLLGAAADWAEDAGAQNALGDIFTTFSDYHMDIVDLVAAGDTVVVRSNVTAIHREVGTRNEIAHIDWYTLRDGKIVQRWATRDSIARS